MPQTIHYRNKQSYDRSVGQQKTEGTSDTEPGQTTEIRDLLIQYSKGMQIHARKLSYFDEEDLSKIGRFYSPSVDLTELDQLDEHIKTLQSAVTKAKQKREQDEQELEDESVSPGGTTSQTTESTSTNTEINPE